MKFCCWRSVRNIIAPIQLKFVVLVTMYFLLGHSLSLIKSRPLSNYPTLCPSPWLYIGKWILTHDFLQSALVQQHAGQQVGDGGVGGLRVAAVVHALQRRPQLCLKVERRVCKLLSQHVPRHCQPLDLKAIESYYVKYNETVFTEQW